MTSQYQYPYDPEGVLPENIVTDKPHTVNPVEGSGYALVVPKAAPFFRRDFELYHTISGKKLTENVDYIFTHMVMDMSHALGEHVYGSVTIVNHNILNNVHPVYRTIGGPHVLEEDKFAEYAIHILEADGAYPWAKLKDVPTEFPVIDHELPMELTAGYDELIDAVKEVSFGNDHIHDIHQVRYLDQVLNNKLDASGNYKVLTDKQLFIGQQFSGSVVVRLPKVKTECTVKAKLQIAETDGLFSLEVAGRVKPYNDGMGPEQWNNIQFTPSYDCWDGDVYLTYDSEHYPCIILGNGKNWFGCHVSILEYFTVNPDQIYGELNPFRLTTRQSLDGIVYTNTKKKGYVVEPPKSEAQLTAVINSKYYGIMPRGFYQGYSLTVYPDSHILVGNPDTMNGAVIYDSGEAGSVLMDKNAILLDVPTPGLYYIVLRLLGYGVQGDAKLTVDIPERAAEIQLVAKDNLPDASIIVGTVDWPDDGTVLSNVHVTYDDRNNATLDSGQFLPVDKVEGSQTF